MHKLIKNLNQNQRKVLWKYINYLNLEEIKIFCKMHEIPYKILYRTDDKIKVTGLTDRKKIILSRMKSYLTTNKISKPTILPEKIINFDPLPTNLKSNNYVYFGQYKNGNKKILDLIKKLTDNKFKFGSKSQEILLHIFSKGEKITYKTFAKLWVKLNYSSIEHSEWAYLKDKKNNCLNLKDWKNKRNKISKEVRKILKF